MRHMASVLGHHVQRLRSGALRRTLPSKKVPAFYRLPVPSPLQSTAFRLTKHVFCGARNMPRMKESRAPPAVEPGFFPQESEAFKLFAGGRTS